MARLPQGRALVIVLVVLISLVVVGAVGVSAYFFWPRSPRVQINSLTIIPQNNAKCDPFTATWNLVFDLKNPNHWSLNYKNITVSVYYEHQLLSSSSSDFFFQKKKSHEKYQTSVLVQNNVSGNGINVEESWMHGNHAFTISMHTRFTYKPLLISWKPQGKMAAICNNVEIGFESFGPFNNVGLIARPEKCVVT